MPGSLEEIQLNPHDQFPSATVPKDEQGLQGVLSKDQTIQGIKLFKGARVTFYSDGKLLVAYLVHDVQEGGPNKTTIAGGFKIFVDFSLYRNGKLMGATLAKNREISGHKLKRGTQIMLDGNGRLSSAVLWEPHYLSGRKFGFSLVVFYPNGKVKEGYLVDHRKIQGVNCGSTFSAKFYKNGKLKCCISKGIGEERFGEAARFDSKGIRSDSEEIKCGPDPVDLPRTSD